MYALHLNAVPDETHQEYDPHQSYTIVMAVNAQSEEAAIEKAKQALREKGWKDIQLQQIRRVPTQSDTSDAPVTEPMIFVFSEEEKSRLQKLKDEAKALVDGFDPLDD